MFGRFQHSQLRIEVDATATSIHHSILYSRHLQAWMWPQHFGPGLPEQLHPGLVFQSWMGPISIEHRVDLVESNCLRLLLSQGIDGYHEWYWGEGWVQSRLEGISVLPLNLGQTYGLLRLREFLRTQKQSSDTRSEK